MSDPVLFVLMSLAAYRLWRLVAVDKLPPIMWARERFEAAVDRRFNAVWADGVTCPWCSGAWVSALVVGAVWCVRPLTLPALWFAAVSTTVGLLAQWDEG